MERTLHLIISGFFSEEKGEGVVVESFYSSVLVKVSVIRLFLIASHHCVLYISLYLCM